MRFEDFLPSVAGEYREDAVGEYRFCCPFCGETKYKFYLKVSLDSDNGLYHCKKCGETGNPITFMKNYFGAKDYKEAKDLLESNGVEMEDTDFKGDYKDKSLTDHEKFMLFLSGIKDTPEVKSDKSPVPLPVNLKYIRYNANTQEAQPFIKYLLGRGITMQQMMSLSIGYVVNGGYYKSDGSYATLRNSVVFFTYDLEGNYIYWNTRSIDSNAGIKSINAPGKKTEYTRKDVVFNLDKAQYAPYIVLHEGVFDALTFHNTGIATFGKQVTDTQVELILSVLKGTEKPLYLFLDKDALTETMNSAEKFYREHPYTYVVPHGEEDANDLGLKESINMIKENAIKATPENLTNFFILEKLG